MGKLVGIARRETTRAPMDILETAAVSQVAGVANDFRGKSRDRTVTLLSAETWQAVCEELNVTIPWTTRRSNFLIEGVELPKQAGGIIYVGAVKLQVTGEVDPCNRMEEQCAGLKNALLPAWRGGVGCVVLEEGEVSLGDTVSIE